MKNHNTSYSGKNSLRTRSAGVLLVASLAMNACATNHPTEESASAKPVAAAPVTKPETVAASRDAAKATQRPAITVPGPDTTIPDEDYAESFEVNRDIETLVDFVNAINPYYREDVSYQPIVNQDGSVTQTTSKSVMNLGTPTGIEVSVVYDNALNGSQLTEVESFAISERTLSAEDVPAIDSIDAITYIRNGSDWMINVADAMGTRGNMTTGERSGRGADNKLSQNTQDSLMDTMMDYLGDLNALEPLPVATTALPTTS